MLFSDLPRQANIPFRCIGRTTAIPWSLRLHPRRCRHDHSLRSRSFPSDDFGALSTITIVRRESYRPRWDTLEANLSLRHTRRSASRQTTRGTRRPSAWSLIHRLFPLKPLWSASLPRPRPTSDASSTVPLSGRRASSRPKSRYVWRRGILARAMVQCRYSRTTRPFTMQKIGTNSTMRSNARLVYAAGCCSARVEIASLSCAARTLLAERRRGWPYWQVAPPSKSSVLLAIE